MLCNIKSRIIFMLILALVPCVCSIELSPDLTLTNHHDNSNTFFNTLAPETTDDKNKKYDDSDGKKSKNNDKKYDSEDPYPTKTEKDNHKSNAKTSDDDGHKSKTESDTTNTVVTTIIVIATETPTPTQIYTGSSQNPANQKGDSSGSSSSDSSDSSSSSSSDGNSSNDGNASDPNNATSNNDNQSNKNRSNYRKMELALSIVGSVGGTALFAGLLILARRQINKKKRVAKKAQDLELGNSPSVPPMATAPSTSGGSSKSIIVPHNQGNNDSVIIDFENPFLDPVAYKKSDQLTASPITPIAPVHLASGSYINFRQNQTLSMLSQTTAAVPSAPTEKEIAANENENPFELDATPQYYLERMNYQHGTSHSHSLSHSVSHSHSDSHSATHSHSNSVSQDNFGSDIVENGLGYNIVQHLPLPPTTVTTNNNNNNSINNSNKIQNLSTSMSSPTGSSSDDLSELPPPAYTPSAIPNTTPNAIPSAPPLYALPNLSRSQQEESYRLSTASTTNGRRHSINSITSTEARPFPLRRGSGSITRISTYFT